MSIVVIDDHTYLFLHVYNFNRKLNSQPVLHHNYYKNLIGCLIKIRIVNMQKIFGREHNRNFSCDGNN